MNHNLIVSVGVGDWHPRGIERLQKSLKDFSNVELMAWADEYPPGCPTHQENPYAFKPYAFLAALQTGAKRVIWCDAALWAVQNPNEVFDMIERDGYYLQANGWWCGQWCTDYALNALELTRDEAMQIPDFVGGCMGLDLGNTVARTFLDKWIHACREKLFIGDWKNDKQQCSQDRRCYGHRHDQVVGSIISYRLGMKLNSRAIYWPAGAWESANPKPPDVVFIGRGM